VATKRPGIMKPISTSKTRKIIANKKNFIQNWQWDEPIGSKPHSYGEKESMLIET